MDTKSIQNQDRIVCNVCDYVNGSWRTECERCRRLLRNGTWLPEYPEPTITYRQVISLISVIPLLVGLLIESCTNFNRYFYEKVEIGTVTNTEPHIETSFDKSSLIVGEWVDNQEKGNKTQEFHNSHLSFKYPPSWIKIVEFETMVAFQVTIDGKTVGTIQISAEQKGYFDEVLSRRWADAQVREDHASGRVISIDRYTSSPLGDLSFVSDVYVIEEIEFEEIRITEQFMKMCADYHICTIRYVHNRQHPMRQEDWKILAEVANSLRIVDSTM